MASRFSLFIGPRSDGFTGLHLSALSLRDVVEALDHWFACCPLIVTTLTGGAFPMRYTADDCARILSREGVDAGVMEGTDILSIPSASAARFAEVIDEAFVWQLSCAPVRQLLTADACATYNIQPGASIGASHFGPEVFIDIAASHGALATKDTKALGAVFNYLCRTGLDDIMTPEERAAADVDFAHLLAIDLRNHQGVYKFKRARGRLSMVREDRIHWGRQRLTWAGAAWDIGPVERMGAAHKWAARAGRILTAVLTLPAVLVIGGVALVGRGLKWWVDRVRGKPAPAPHPPKQ